MNRKPIFDAVRAMLGRSFKPSEVKALDRACDLAEAARPSSDSKPTGPTPPGAVRRRLGSLSERYESGGRGCGTVSSGRGDPGGVSYGTYQLSSKAGTLAAFMKAEGKRWASEFAGAALGSERFSTCWKDVAAREAEEFGEAQHRFIERTHYRRAVDEVRLRKGLDLDARHDAVRDAVWSVAVQHGGAAAILITAIDAADRKLGRTDRGYDRQFVEEIYKARTEYVLGVSRNPRLPASQREQLVAITRNRYPSELAACLKMFDETPVDSTPPDAPAVNPDGTIDGNAVARQHGVDVKSKAVKIANLHPAMSQVIAAVAEAANRLGLPRPVITSGNDGNHLARSLHYKGRALDFRGNNIQPSVGEAFRAEVAKLVGEEYDVLFETFLNAANNHLHVEYDPT